MTQPRQLARIALGLCGQCGDDVIAVGQLCNGCRDRQNAQHRAGYRLRGGKGHSEARKSALAQLRRAERAWRIAHKRCLQCGVPVKRFQRCPECGRKAAIAKRRRRMKVKCEKVMARRSE